MLDRVIPPLRNARYPKHFKYWRHFLNGIGHHRKEVHFLYERDFAAICCINIHPRQTNYWVTVVNQTWQNMHSYRGNEVVFSGMDGWGAVNIRWLYTNLVCNSQLSLYYKYWWKMLVWYLSWAVSLQRARGPIKHVPQWTNHIRKCTCIQQEYFIYVCRF